MKKGFSFVELLLILAFFLVLLMALTPMITRRHLAPPGKANHGTYACYREVSGNLHETLIKGRVTIKDVTLPAGQECNFEPVKNAKYYYVQLIGGGGAGKKLDRDDVVSDGGTASSTNYYVIRGKKGYDKTSPENAQKVGFFVGGCNKTINGGDGSNNQWKLTAGGCNASQATTSGIFTADQKELYEELVGAYKILLYGNGFRGKRCTDDVIGDTNNGFLSPTNRLTGQNTSAQRIQRVGNICQTGIASYNPPYCSLAVQEADKEYVTDTTVKLIHADLKLLLDSGNNKYFAYNCPTEKINATVDSTAEGDPIYFKTYKCSACNDATYLNNINTYTTASEEGPKFSGRYVGQTFTDNSSNDHVQCQLPNLLPQDNPYYYDVDTTSYKFQKAVPLKDLFMTTIESKALVPKQSGIPESYPQYNKYISDDKYGSMNKEEHPEALKASDGVGQEFTWTDNEGNKHEFNIYGGTGLVVSHTKSKLPSKYTDGGNDYCVPASFYNKYNIQQKDKVKSASAEYLVKDSSDQELSKEAVNSVDSITYSEDEYDYRKLRFGKIRLTQSQEIPYGIGGKAGELKSMILRDIPENVPMHPGWGGKATGSNDNNRSELNEGGRSGEDTTFGGGASGIPERRAQGGRSGELFFTQSIKVDPYFYDEDGNIVKTTGADGKQHAMIQGQDSYNGSLWRTETTHDMSARYGEELTYSAFVKFVISYNSGALRERMKDFGRGGDGASTIANCTKGYDYQPIVLLNSDTTASLTTNILINKVFDDDGERNYYHDKYLDYLNGGCNGGYTWKERYGLNKSHIDNDETKPYRSDTNTSYITNYKADTPLLSLDYSNNGVSGYWAGQVDHGDGKGEQFAVDIYEEAQDGKSGAIVISW